MEMQDESKVDRFGRVLIPRRVREALELTAGTALALEVREGELALRPRPQEPTLVRKGRVLVAQVEAVQDPEGVSKKTRMRALRRRARPAP
jgi:AbrB family looped-hinge helix DNA binding protein